MVLYGVTVIFSPSLCTKCASYTRRVDGDATVHSLLTRLQGELKLQRDAEDLEVYCVPATHLWLGSAGISTCCDRSRQLSINDRILHAPTHSHTLGHVLYLTVRNWTAKDEGDMDTTKGRTDSLDVAAAVGTETTSSHDDSVCIELPTIELCGTGDRQSEGLGERETKVSGEAQAEREVLSVNEIECRDLELDSGVVGYESPRRNRETGIAMEGTQEAWVSESDSEGVCNSTHLRKYLPGLKRFSPQLLRNHGNQPELPLADTSLSTPLQVPPSERSDKGRGVAIPPSHSEHVALGSGEGCVELVPDEKVMEVVTILSSAEELEEGLLVRDSHVNLERTRGEANKAVVECDSAFDSTVDSTNHCNYSLTQHTTTSPPLTPSSLAASSPLRSLDAAETSDRMTNGELPCLGWGWVCKEEGEEGEGSDEGIGMEVVGESGDSGEGGSVIVIESDTDDGRSHSKFDGGSGTEQSHVVNCCGMELSRNDLRTLSPNQCLNDQVINCYMKLLMREGLQEKNSIFIASTFFYTKLCRSGVRGVARWMKNVDFAKLSLFLVPIHLSDYHHWCLAAIHLKRKVIEYYDSLGMRNPRCMKKLFQFVCSRIQKHIKSPSIGKHWWLSGKAKHWRKCYPKGLPKQSGNFDCGVFLCQFARWLCCTRGCPHSSIPFTQSHMYRIRQIMRQELELGKLVQ